MQHHHLSRVAALTCFLWAGVNPGCMDHPTGPSDIPLGQSFELHPGTSAVLSDGLKVTFDGVRADSRCPMDVVCVWAGDATVALRLSQPPATQAERALHTDPAGAEAQYLSYVITLVALAPYPRSDRQIRPDDYVATLRVEVH